MLSSFLRLEEITIHKDGITVISDFFDSAKTLECGQLFRFSACEDGFYRVLSGAHSCKIRTSGNKTVIKTGEPLYFYDYFDLRRDYAAVTDALNGFGELIEPAGFGKGIHILKQDLFETVISFIISANNNIPRIKSIIERICLKYGSAKDGYQAFPRPEQLKGVSRDEFFALGAGYRDRYLAAAANILSETDILSRLPELDYENAVKLLCTIPGVGPKVADCITLFALGHTRCYPVDTWMMHSDAGINETKEAVRKRGMQRYGALAGFAQQFKFYYAREHTIKSSAKRSFKGT